MSISGGWEGTAGKGGEKGGREVVISGERVMSSRRFSAASRCGGRPSMGEDIGDVGDATVSKLPNARPDCPNPSFCVDD